MAKPASSKPTTSKRSDAHGREDAVMSVTEGTDVEKVKGLLDAHPGKPQPIPVSSSDVGGELLALLSKGLYTNPLDSIREYVQNSVDADAQNVTIKISGNSLQIF